MQWRRKGQTSDVFGKDDMSRTQRTTKRGTIGRGRVKHTQAKGAQESKLKGSRRVSRAATSQPSTKAAQIFALLKRPAGSTLKSIMVATGWQAHSVRGFISGHLVKKMGLRVKSVRQNNERVYLIKS
jgi:hypothetical protein